MIIALFIICGFLIVWIGILTYFFWTLSSHYSNLLKTTNKKTMQGVLDSLIFDLDLAKKDIASLQKTCDTIMKDGKQHIQKVGLLRFNPFKETGGDQSFILSLLDAENNGIVISGLYSRSGTRWYAKKVAKGTGVEHNLSEEEKEAVRQAKAIVS